MRIENYMYHIKIYVSHKDNIGHSKKAEQT